MNPGAYARLAATCAAAGTAAAVGLAGPAMAAAAPTLTLSSTTGPSGGGNPITATAAATTANPNPFPAGGTPTVQFQYSGTGSTACSAKTKDNAPITTSGTTTTGGVQTVDPADVAQVSTTKVAFAVPSTSYPAQLDSKPSTVNPAGLTLGDGQTSAKYLVCVYDSASTTSSTLLATGTYTIYVRPRIAKVLPTSSPASGGQAITVNGVGFSTTGTTATIGGAAVTGVKVNAAGTSFTAVTPPHVAAADLPLVVSTLGGPVSSLDPDNNGQPQDKSDDTPDVPIPFSYSNGITITPNYAPAGTKVSIDVRGVGFSDLSFNKGTGGSPTDEKAHVFLVKDAYVAATNRGVQECQNVLVITGTELVCTLDLTADALDPEDSTPVSGVKVPEGTYTVTVVANGSTTADKAASPSIVSTGSTFTVGPY